MHVFARKSKAAFNESLLPHNPAARPSIGYRQIVNVVLTELDTTLRPMPTSEFADQAQIELAVPLIVPGIPSKTAEGCADPTPILAQVGYGAVPDFVVKISQGNGGVRRSGRSPQPEAHPRVAGPARIDIPHSKPPTPRRCRAPPDVKRRTRSSGRLIERTPATVSSPTVPGANAFEVINQVGWRRGGSGTPCRTRRGRGCSGGSRSGRRRARACSGVRSRRRG